MYPFGMCRLCEIALHNNDGLDSLRMLDFLVHVKTLLGIEIRSTDSCSTHVCRSCVAKVLAFGMFRKRSITTQDNIGEYQKINEQAQQFSEGVNAPIKIEGRGVPFMIEVDLCSEDENCSDLARPLVAPDTTTCDAPMSEASSSSANKRRRLESDRSNDTSRGQSSKRFLPATSTSTASDNSYGVDQNARKSTDGQPNSQTVECVKCAKSLTGIDEQNFHIYAHEQRKCVYCAKPICGLVDIQVHWDMCFKRSFVPFKAEVLPKSVVPAMRSCSVRLLKESYIDEWSNKQQTPADVARAPTRILRGHKALPQKQVIPVTQIVKSKDEFSVGTCRTPKSTEQLCREPLSSELIQSANNKIGALISKLVALKAPPSNGPTRSTTKVKPPTSITPPRVSNMETSFVGCKPPVTPDSHSNGLVENGTPADLKITSLANQHPNDTQDLRATTPVQPSNGPAANDTAHQAMENANPDTPDLRATTPVRPSIGPAANDTADQANANVDESNTVDAAETPLNSAYDTSTASECDPNESLLMVDERLTKRNNPIQKPKKRKGHIKFTELKRNDGPKPEEKASASVAPSANATETIPLSVAAPIKGRRKTMTPGTRLFRQIATDNQTKFEQPSTIPPTSAPMSAPVSTKNIVVRRRSIAPAIASSDSRQVMENIPMFGDPNGDTGTTQNQPPSHASYPEISKILARRQSVAAVTVTPQPAATAADPQQQPYQRPAMFKILTPDELNFRSVTTQNLARRQPLRPRTAPLHHAMRVDSLLVAPPVWLPAPIGHAVATNHLQLPTFVAQVGAGGAPSLQNATIIPSFSHSPSLQHASKAPSVTHSPAPQHQPVLPAAETATNQSTSANPKIRVLLRNSCETLLAICLVDESSREIRMEEMSKEVAEKMRITFNVPDNLEFFRKNFKIRKPDDTAMALLRRLIDKETLDRILP